jgi:hypothetical protein
VPWRTLYQSCISETNPDRLQKLVFQLEEAIVLRYHDLADQPNAFDELQAIKRAAQRLLRLKIEKLGWLDASSHEALPKSAAIPASIPASFQTFSSQIDDPVPVTRRPNQTAWQKLVSRIQVALLAVERAWQSWVFKGLK